MRKAVCVGSICKYINLLSAVARKYRQQEPRCQYVATVDLVGPRLALVAPCDTMFLPTAAKMRPTQSHHS